MYNNIHRILIYLREQQDEVSYISYNRPADDNGKYFFYTLLNEFITGKLMYTMNTGESVETVWKRTRAGKVDPNYNADDMIQETDMQAINDWIENDRIFDYMNLFAKYDHNKELFCTGFNEAKELTKDFIYMDLGYIGGESSTMVGNDADDMNKFYFHVVSRAKEAGEVRPDENLTDSEKISRHAGYVDGMICYAERCREFILYSLKYSLSNNDMEPLRIYKRHNNGRPDNAYEENPDLHNEAVKRVIKWLNVNDSITAPYEIQNTPSTHLLVKEHILVDEEVYNYRMAFKQGSAKMSRTLHKYIIEVMRYDDVEATDTMVTYNEKPTILLPDYEVGLYRKTRFQVDASTYDFESHAVKPKSHIQSNKQTGRGSSSRFATSPGLDQTGNMTKAHEMIQYVIDNKYGNLTLSKSAATKSFTMIERNLLPDEVVLTCFYGLHNHISMSKHDYEHAYALTNKRFVFCRAGFWTGGDFKTINANGITSVNSQKYLLSTKIVINYVGGVLNVLIQERDCERLVNELSALIIR